MLFAFVPMLGTSFYAYTQARRGFEEQVGQSVEGIAQTVGGEVASAVSVADQQLAVWSTQNDAKIAASIYGQTLTIYALLQKRFSNFLAGQKRSLPIFASILCVRPAAAPKVGSPTAAEVLFSDEERYQGGRILPDFWVQHADGVQVNPRYVWTGGGDLAGALQRSPFEPSRTVLPIAREYRDPEGAALALVGLIDWRELQRLIENTSVGGAKLSELAAQGHTFVALADREGNVLGGTAPAGLFAEGSLAALLGQVIPGRAVQPLSLPKLGDALAGVRQLGDNGLSVIAVRTAKHAFAPVRRLRNASLAAALIVLAVVLGLAFQLTERITAPVKELVRGTQLAAAGDLRPIHLKRRDEIGELALSFNVMVEKLEDSFERLGAQNEALRRLDKLKDEFLANTSHELRTPLHGIIGVLSAMLEGAYGEVSAVQREKLEMAVASGQRLSGLVNGILDFSSATRGEYQLQLEEVQLGLLIERELLPLWEGVNRAKGLALKLELEPDLPPLVGDREKVRQVLMNLVGNAIKFTREGHVTLSCSTVGEGASRRFHLRVSDSGVGIPESELEAIFEPFRQVKGGADREFAGTGLGLAIVKKHVESHGGRIWAESSPGQGSTFHVELPVTAAPERAPAGPSTPPALSHAEGLGPNGSGAVQAERRPSDLGAPPSPPADPVTQPALPTAPPPGVKVRIGQGERIWVIDDEPVNIEVIRARLEMARYRVEGFGSALAALEALKGGQELPDLILLDIMMPQMSGYEFCSQLHANERWRAIPVIMLSAKTQLVDKIYGLNLGALDYMTKPFQKEELLSKIRVFLDLRIGQRMREELEMASAVQAMLVPPARFEGPGCEFASRLLSCTEVGGDWFNLFHDPERGCTAVVMADVSGHGAPAALGAGILHGFFHSVRDELTATEDWQGRLNRVLQQLNQTVLGSTHRSLTLSLLVLCFDHPRRRAQFANAGHVNPVVVKPGQGPAQVAAVLCQPSSLIGDLDRPAFSFAEVQLEPGHYLLLYTDGLVEGMNRSQRIFGARRLHKALSHLGGQGADVALEAVLQDALAFYGDMPRSDDISLIVGRVR